MVSVQRGTAAAALKRGRRMESSMRCSAPFAVETDGVTTLINSKVPAQHSDDALDGHFS